MEVNEPNPSWICVAVLRDFVGEVMKVAWDPTLSLEFVTGSYDSSLCVWKVVDDDDESRIKVNLKWCSTDKHRLVATGARITEAIGFNEEQRRLLRQKGAIANSELVEKEEIIDENDTDESYIEKSYIDGVAIEDMLLATDVEAESE